MRPAAEGRPSPLPRALYHYACAHAAADLARSCQLIPAHRLADRTTRVALDADPLTAIVSRWCWLTDHSCAAEMWANTLGLHDTLLACDQPGVRFQVTDRTRVIPFLVLLAQYPALSPLTKGRGDPLHWFVSWASVPVVAYHHPRQRRPRKELSL